MRIAVTGATGFIGSNLTTALKARGHTIVPMSRHSERPGNILEKDYVASCLEGCQIVFHLAAKVGAGSAANQYLVNYQGTKNLLEAAKAAHVLRLIHISSLAVMDEYQCHRGTTELTKAPLEQSDFYASSKKKAEDALLGSRTDVPFLVLRPGWVWGRGDKSTIELIDMVRKGNFRFIGDGENLTYFTYIDNLIDLLVGLIDLEPFPRGEVFNITDGDERTMKEFVNAIAGALGVKVPKKKVSKRLALMLASAVETISKEPTLTKQNVNILSNDLFFPIDKARKMLHYSPSTDYIAQVMETVAWLREHGKL